MTYPACGCTSECRLCNYLSSKDKKATKPTVALVVFRPGYKPEQVLEAMYALGKDTVSTVEVTTYDPEKEQVGLKRSARKAKTNAQRVEGE